MSKILLIICMVLLFAGNLWASGNRLGVQFSSGGDLGLIYYGEDYGWAVGGQFGFKNEEGKISDFNVDWDLDSEEYTLFARKNFDIADKTRFGLGVLVTWGFWDEWIVIGEPGNSDVLTGITTKAESFKVAPYFIIDYQLNDNFILNAGAMIVSFENIDYEWEGNDEYVSVDKTAFFEPFFSLTYLF